MERQFSVKAGNLLGFANYSRLPAYIRQTGQGEQDSHLSFAKVSCLPAAAALEARLPAGA